MQRIILPSGKEVDLDTATEDHTGIAIELQPRSAPVIKTSEPKVARSKAVSGDRRTKRKAKTKNSPSPQKSRLTKQQTGLGMPRSHTLSSTFCSTPDFVTPSNSNMATPDSQKQYSALLSVSSSASSEEEDFPLITSSVPQVPPPQMLMEDMMDGRSHLEALEQIFASDSESEVDEGEEEGGSTVKPAATGGRIICTLSTVCACVLCLHAHNYIRMSAIRALHSRWYPLIHFYCGTPLSQHFSVNFLIDDLTHFHCRVCKIEFGARQP